MAGLPAAVSHKLTSLFQRLPGGTRGARLLWLWHLLAILALLVFLKDWKVPEVWTSDATTPKPHKFSEYLHMGLYRGALIHIALSALLLLTVRWWGRPESVTMETRLRRPRMRPVWFWPVLGLIVIAAFSLRWPRMDHSYWGDEGWALRHYVYGEFQPAVGDDYQGELKFVPITWQRVLWDDRTGGNHFLFSILQKFTLGAWRSIHGHPEWAFHETLSRLPLLAAGLGSIVAFALFLNWLGRPTAGLCGALWFALHPWHIRYSTEARGYILMLFFFILAIWVLFIALRDGRWRWWLLFIDTQFLAIYSWKVAALPLVGINLLALLWLLRPRNGPLRARLTSCARLIAAGLTMSAFFLFLYLPCSLQSPRALVRLQHTGKPMDDNWLRNSLTGLLCGTPWHRDSRENPTEVPLEERVLRKPLPMIGFAAAIGLIAFGAARLLRESPSQAILWLSVIACAAAGAALFKWKVKIEWIFWYSFFVILPLGVFHAIGMEYVLGRARRWWSRRRGVAVALLLLAGITASSAYALQFPQIRLMDWQPYESNREAFQLTRGKHEPWGYHGLSTVKTCYLWRHIYLYDPRADVYVRTPERLRELMAEADRTGTELYYVVGQRGLFRALQKDVMALLENQQLFDRTATLWAELDIHTLEIYHYRRQR